MLKVAFCMKDWRNAELNLSFIFMASNFYLDNSACCYTLHQDVEEPSTD